MGEGVSCLHRILGRVEAEGQRAVDRSADAGSGGHGDGLLAAHIRPHQIRNGIIGVVLQLVLYPLIHRVGLHHRLRGNKLVTKTVARASIRLERHSDKDSLEVRPQMHQNKIFITNNRQRTVYGCYEIKICALVILIHKFTKVIPSSALFLSLI